MTERPPRLASLLLSLVAPRTDTAEILGDLQERFAHRVDVMGRRAAERWYWKQALGAVGRLTISRLVRVPRTLAGAMRRNRNMLTWFGRDLRFAFRNLRRTPGFAAVAVLTLALGVGANTAIFSVVNGVVLRPLPYHDPQRLVTVWAADRERGTTQGPMSQPDLRDIQAGGHSFQALAGYSAGGLTLTGLGAAEVIQGAQVTDGLLDVFEARPALGRDIRTEESVPDGPRVVVIGHAFWRERLGGDRDVLGRTLELSGRRHEIVGVAPAGFEYPDGASLWVPRYLNTDDCGRGCHLLHVVGRLAPDATLGGARREATMIAARLEEAYPEDNFAKGFNVITLGESVYGDVRTGLLVLLGAVAIVLLISCANVANLLLVRASSRTGEIAVRSALGASTNGIVRQLLLEALVLATLGGGLGLLFAGGGLRALLTLAPANLPRLDEVRLDATVLAFALGTVVSITLIFGIVPALRLARVPVAETLHQSGRGELGRGRQNWFRSSLLVGEVALSLTLLVGAGLLLRSLSRMQHIDVGFDKEDTLTFSLSLPGVRYTEPDDVVRFFETLEGRLQALPQVVAVGSVFGSPMGGNNIGTTIDFLDRPAPPAGQEDVMVTRIVTPGYLETLKVPVIRGRAFAASDRDGAPLVALVTAQTAEKYYPGQDPIGKQVRLHLSFGYPAEEARTIIGVVGDIRSRRLTREPGPETYLPEGQMGSSFLTLLVRTAPGAGSVLPAVRREVQALDADLPLRKVEMLHNTVDRSFGPARFHLTLLTIFAGVAVTLAAVGLYGVVGYLVSQRRQEIGVRMALGAKSADVVHMMIVQGGRPAALGIALGLGAALVGAKVLDSLLYGVAPRDPVTLIAVTGLLIAVVVAAILIPAFRASRVAPVAALTAD